MTKEVVPFFVPSITKEDKKKVIAALGSRWLTGGPRAKEFEELFAQYVGTKYAVAVNSCTAALHLALRALGIGSSDEVIVPTLTFAATANAPLFCGARPIFADIDEITFNISPEDVAKHITKRTKAIIVVHYAGQPCNMNEITQLADKFGIYVIEDCAHSLGATYSGRQTGGLGTAGCFSFYPTKNITTMEGGMVTTNDKKLADRITILRSHGMTREAWERSRSSKWYYDVVDLGYNYRLNEVQVALGISQLSRVDLMSQQRARKAKYYTTKLGKIKGIIPPQQAENRTHAFHIYAVRVIQKEFGVSRDALFAQLSKRGIGLSVHYTPLHLLTYYRETLGCKPGDYPVAEKVYNELLSLPIFPKLRRKQIDYVIQKILESANIS